MVCQPGADYRQGQSDQGANSQGVRMGEAASSNAIEQRNCRIRGGGAESGKSDTSSGNLEASLQAKWIYGYDVSCNGGDLVKQPPPFIAS